MSELTRERLAELRRIAEEATQGDWSIVLGSGNNVCTWVVREHEDGSATFIADCLPEDDLAIEAAEKDHRPNMRHISAFDPPTVLALLDEIDRLRREREAVKHHLFEARDYCAMGSPMLAHSEITEALALLDGERGGGGK